MPPHLLGDANTSCHNTNSISHQRLVPVWFSTPAVRTSEDPVARGLVLRMGPPGAQGFARNGSSGTGFCDASVLHGPTTCRTMERVTRTSFLTKSISVHLRPKSSLARNPVTNRAEPWSVRGDRGPSIAIGLPRFRGPPGSSFVWRFGVPIEPGCDQAVHGAGRG